MKGEFMSKDTCEYRIKKWKQKAVCRNTEIKYLKRKLSDTEKSRIHFRDMFYELKATLPKQTIGKEINTSSAPRHKYPLILVWLCTQWQSYGAMSFRSCRHCLCSVCLILQLEGSLPSHVSIRSWICKCANYRIEKEKNNAGIGKWVYIVDESLSIGNQKILLILGVDLEVQKFENAVTMQETRVLHVDVSNQWKAEQIQPIIEQIAKHHPLAYTLSDRGNNLVKSYTLAGVDFVPDCTHAIANALAHIYENEDTFKEFTALCGLLRKKWIMSKYVAYAPPSQKSKVRFANIFPLVEWACKMIQLPQEKVPLELKENLDWLPNHKEWLLEFWQIREVSRELCQMWKTEGFTKENRIKAELLFAKCQSIKAQKFATEMQTYIQLLVPYLEKYPNVLCCSDIIESTFGKFKQKIKANSANRMTEFILTIANFGSDFTQQEVKKALTEIKNKDLSKIGSKTPSLAQKKKDIFGQKKGKKLVES